MIQINDLAEGFFKTEILLGYGTFHMSHGASKPVFGVFDQVRHKPGCTAT